MNQKTMQCFTSECGKVMTYVDNDMPLGKFHDYLMFLKGTMVDKMIEAQKQETEIAAAQKSAENSDTSCDTQ